MPAEPTEPTGSDQSPVPAQPLPDGRGASAGATVPTDRYGTRRPAGRRPLAVVGAVALLAAGVGLAAWFAFGSSSADVRGKNVGFEVLGAETVVLTFDVAKPEDATVVCTVEALSSNYAQVGAKEVTVGPADVSEQRIRTEIATSEEAVTAVVDACRLQD